MLQRRNTITVCESPQVSPTSPENQSPSLNHGHESKLKRTGPVTRSNACASELRKRLNDKLHGSSSVSRLHSRRVHGSISEVPSETDNIESYPDSKSDRVKPESQSTIRRVSSARVPSNSSVQNKITNNSGEVVRVRRSSHRVTQKSESNSNTQSNDLKTENRTELQTKLTEYSEKIARMRKSSENGEKLAYR